MNEGNVGILEVEHVETYAAMNRRKERMGLTSNEDYSWKFTVTDRSLVPPPSPGTPSQAMLDYIRYS